MFSTKFSLRLIFVAIGCASIGLAFFAREKSRFNLEFENAQAVERGLLGDCLCFDFLEHRPVWNVGEILKGRLYKPVEAVLIWGYVSSLSDIEPLLVDFRYLRCLHFSPNGKPENLIDFSKFMSLKELEISFYDLKDSEVRSILKLEVLSSLTLEGCKISESALAMLSDASIDQIQIDGRDLSNQTKQR